MFSEKTVIYSATNNRSQLVADAARDLVTSSTQYRIWMTMALHDIRMRYRGSILGPWWITISMGFLISGMSVLYAGLMGLELKDYVPWLACGIVIWGLIATTMTEGCDAFIGGSQIIRQSATPLFTFVLRILARNLIVFGHNFLIVVAVSVIFGFWRHMRPLEVVLALGAILLSLSWMVTLVALASARFRDVPQIVASVLQIALFLTPVFWHAEQLPNRPAILWLNPFYHLLEILRAPLMGAPTNSTSWPVVGLMGLVGWLCVFPLFAAHRRRVVHYL